MHNRLLKNEAIEERYTQVHFSHTAFHQTKGPIQQKYFAMLLLLSKF